MVLGRAAGPHDTVRMNRQSRQCRRPGPGKIRCRRLEGVRSQLLTFSPRLRSGTDASDEDVQLVKKLAVTLHAAQVPINDCPATID
jgi:hypothetical protein